MITIAKLLLHNGRKEVRNETSDQFSFRFTNLVAGKSSSEVYRMPQPNKEPTLKSSTLSSTFKPEDIGRCPPRIEMTEIDRGAIPDELYRVAPSVFDHIPRNFENGLRSPCWKSHGNLSCLPSFMLAGMGKCGSTDVWTKIASHPDIIEIGKEPRWWTRGRIGRDNPLSFEWYTEWFDKLAKSITESRSSKQAQRLLAGDGSPSILFDNTPWKYTLTDACHNLTTPRYVIADVIRTVLPKIKILAVFRNPTSRIYSDYIYRDPKYTRETFHVSVTQTMKTFESCLEKMTHRECIFKLMSKIYHEDVSKHETGQLGYHPFMKLFKGFYSVFVKDWLRDFPREQMMFFTLEDWNSSCETILPEIYKFLELEPLSRDTTNATCHTKRMKETGWKISTGPMLNTTKQLLDQFYEPTRKELAKILGDDRFLWD